MREPLDKGYLTQNFHSKHLAFEIEAREAEQRGGDYDKTEKLQRY